MKQSGSLMTNGDTESFVVSSILEALPPVGARVSDGSERSDPMPPSSEFTRLYRIQSSAKVEAPDWVKQGQIESGHIQAEGRWFVADPAMLDWYRADAN